MWQRQLPEFAIQESSPRRYIPRGRLRIQDRRRRDIGLSSRLRLSPSVEHRALVSFWGDGKVRMVRMRRGILRFVSALDHFRQLQGTQLLRVDMRQWSRGSTSSSCGWLVDHQQWYRRFHLLASSETVYKHQTSKTTYDVDRGTCCRNQPAHLLIVSYEFLQKGWKIESCKNTSVSNLALDGQ